MIYYVYLIKTTKGFKNKSYVGFTNNIKSRLIKHNTNKGAKATKGYKWELIYKKSFFSKFVSDVGQKFKKSKLNHWFHLQIIHKYKSFKWHRNLKKAKEER